jgi:hypothetical protein
MPNNSHKNTEGTVSIFVIGTSSRTDSDNCGEKQTMPSVVQGVA